MLVNHAVAAEQTGFTTAMISDHLQPWVTQQGHAPFVWTVLGAIVQATDGLEVGTGVTAFGSRNSPITIAQAAATVATMAEGRFFLGVGSGERLNEQPFGKRWPRAGERREQLAEAIEVVRSLWQGANVNHRGPWFAVENLTLMTLPAAPAPVLVAASGTRSAELAGKEGDGLIAVAPDAHLMEVFRGSGGTGKRASGQLHVSLAPSLDEAVDNAWRWWTHGVVPPAVLAELARPKEFDTVAQAIGREPITRAVVCATDDKPIVAAVDRFFGAGFDTVYLHQVGPDQRRLLDCGRDLLAHYANNDS